jgi:ketosteroid isomerase-like protein
VDGSDGKTVLQGRLHPRHECCLGARLVLVDTDRMTETAKRHLKIVRQNYDAFNNGDIDGVMAPMHPEVEVVVADENARADPAQHYRGSRDVRQFFEEIKQTVGFSWVEVEEITATETSIVVNACIHGLIRETGKEGSIPAVHRYTFEGDEIIRVETFRPDWRSD